MSRNCILSFTLSGHGFSGAVCINGQIVAATSLERITREKNDIFLPITKQDLKDFGWRSDPSIYKNSLNLPFDLELDASSICFEEQPKFKAFLDYLLDAGGFSLSDVDCVVFSYRYVEQARAFFAKYCPNADFLVPEHHLAHACQAFLSSPHDEAAIMVVDGQGVPMERTGGDQLAGNLAYGKGDTIKILHEIPVRYSLGGIYAAFTSKVGFKTNEEGKTMGLAPYGSDTLYKELKKELRFDVNEYNFRKFGALLRRGFQPEHVLYALPNYSAFLNKYKRRSKGEPIEDFHKDLAYAVQKLTEDVMIYLANWLHKKTGAKNLCIAGGVGLNCVANYQVLINTPFEHVYVHPNPGDNGLAIGQALWAYTIDGKCKRKYIATNDYLGRKYSEAEFRSAVDSVRGRDDVIVSEFDDLQNLYEQMASDIADGKITSWCQGRSEFGPRALGNRSILADPRRADMKDILNSRVKFRESFRPFTPSVLAERCNEFFELEFESPFMLHAAYVRSGKAELVPAITHEDNTARIQTVTSDVNERYYGLIKAFEKITGIPMVLDTSFNIADEPIVETPADAIRCFLSTDIDVLGIDKFIIRKLKKTHTPRQQLGS
ncbi:carbamoyltransferase [Formivibrio citricus]|uniref:Carbamoyltransferase n=1 Tax=Formivibrio citricus TaxID=83765 RepID=A0A1I4XWU1_9NEIS|nr:carbamoyltransferase C-terminal domain-containing protein [Formivibrio citricus]SFN30274.1 carbamoyltransferase [Formivibrio citricus]